MRSAQPRQLGGKTPYGIRAAAAANGNDANRTLRVVRGSESAAFGCREKTEIARCAIAPTANAGVATIRRRELVFTPIINPS